MKVKVLQGKPIPQEEKRKGNRWLDDRYILQREWAFEQWHLFRMYSIEGLCKFEGG